MFDRSPEKIAKWIYDDKSLLEYKLIFYIEIVQSLFDKYINKNNKYYHSNLYPKIWYEMGGSGQIEIHINTIIGDTRFLTIISFNRLPPSYSLLLRYDNLPRDLFNNRTFEPISDRILNFDYIINRYRKLDRELKLNNILDFNTK